jgi:hypothetical protein
MVILWFLVTLGWNNIFIQLVQMFSYDNGYTHVASILNSCSFTGTQTCGVNEKYFTMLNNEYLKRFFQIMLCFKVLSNNCLYNYKFGLKNM